MAKHDTGYKLLFSHASVVADVLDSYRPRLRYALLDETQIPDMELEAERNVAAALFRLEKSRDLEDFRQQVGRMAAGPEMDEGLQASVYTWLTQVLLPARFPGMDLAEASSLEEVRTMLAERVMEWTREWKREGQQEGLQQGLEQGVSAFQDFLLSEIRNRFGLVPTKVRQQVETTRDFAELKTLGNQLLAAASLSDLDRPSRAVPGRRRRESE